MHPYLNEQLARARELDAARAARLAPLTLSLRWRAAPARGRVALRPRGAGPGSAPAAVRRSGEAQPAFGRGR